MADQELQAEIIRLEQDLFELTKKIQNLCARVGAEDLIIAEEERYTQASARKRELLIQLSKIQA